MTDLNKKQNLRLLTLVTIFLVLAAVGFALYIHTYSQLKDARLKISAYENDPVFRNRVDQQQLLHDISMSVNLPDETPTIATVTDLTKLQNQPFFSKAEVGDKVVLYTIAKEAILYRPAEHKVIAIAPFNAQTGIGISAVGDTNTQSNK